MRRSFDLDIEIDFGVSITQQATINNIMAVTQMLAQSPNADPAKLEALQKELITQMLGDNADVAAMFQNIDEQRLAAQQAATQEQIAAQQAAADQQAQVEAAMAADANRRKLEKYISGAL